MAFRDLHRSLFAPSAESQSLMKEDGKKSYEDKREAQVSSFVDKENVHPNLWRPKLDPSSEMRKNDFFSNDGLAKVNEVSKFEISKNKDDLLFFRDGHRHTTPHETRKDLIVKENQNSIVTYYDACKGSDRKDTFDFNFFDESKLDHKLTKVKKVTVTKSDNESKQKTTILLDNDNETKSCSLFADQRLVPPGPLSLCHVTEQSTSPLKKKFSPIGKPARNRNTAILPQARFTSYDPFQQSLFSDSNCFWLSTPHFSPNNPDHSELANCWVEPAMPNDDSQNETSPKTKNKQYVFTDHKNLSINSQQLNVVDDWLKTEVFPVESAVHLLPKHVVLTRSDYASIIAGYTASRNEDGAKKAECILKYILAENEAGRSTVRPDGGCYNKVLHAYADLGNLSKAEEVMQLMCRVFDDGDSFAEPNNRHYTTLIYAWQKSGSSNSPEQCERIIEQMHKLHELGKFPKCKPDIFSYTSVFHCWANSDRPDASDRAEELFRKMQDRCHRGDNDLLPDTITYSNLINTFMKQKQSMRAENILWEMVDDFLKGNVSCKPTTRNFNTVLAMWSTSKDIDAPVHAENIVKRWLKIVGNCSIEAKPDKYSYGLLLKCWSLSERQDTSDKVSAILTWMGKRADLGDKDARLDFIKCSTGVKAHLRFKKYSRADCLVHKMIDEFVVGQSNEMPDFRILNCVISGLCDECHPREADALLRRMWKFNRSVKGYRSTETLTQHVLQAWVAFGHIGSAEALLETMQRLHDSRMLRESPIPEHYRIVISAFKSSGELGTTARINHLQKKLNRNSGRQDSTSLHSRFSRSRMF